MEGKNCDFCKKSENGMGAVCQICGFNFCGSCYNRLTTQIPNQARHNHPLSMSKRTFWKCDICKNSFNNIISMFCKQCDFDCCIDCFYKQ
jgi:pentatricopeptide repeat protein